MKNLGGIWIIFFIIFGVSVGVVIGVVLLVTYIIPDYMLIPKNVDIDNVKDTKLWLSVAAFLFTVIGFVIGLAGIISPAMQFFSNKRYLDKQADDFTEKKSSWDAQKEEMSKQLLVLSSQNNDIEDKKNFYFSNQLKINDLERYYLNFLLENYDFDYEINNSDAGSIARSNLQKQMELQKFKALLFKLSTSDDGSSVLKTLKLLAEYIFDNGSNSSIELNDGVSNYLLWLYMENIFKGEKSEGDRYTIKEKFIEIMEEHFSRKITVRFPVI